MGAIIVRKGTVVGILKVHTPMIIGIAGVIGEGVVFPIDIDANVVISAGVVGYHYRRTRFE